MPDAVAEIPETFTTEEAVSWLRSVDGELYRTPPGRHAARAWIAVVRTPRFGSQRGQLILALGNTARRLAASATPVLSVPQGSLAPADAFVLSRVDGALTAREIVEMKRGARRRGR